MEVPAIAPGTRVRVRRRTWVVTGVDSGERCRLLTLAGVGADNARRELVVIEPVDDIEPVAERTRPRRVGARTWRRACRAAILEACAPGSLRTASSARIDLFAYQLEPALALLQGRGTRVLIADDVGLGKTVQAALVIAELRARGAAGRVLILCPAGLREQWADECRERFALELFVFDQAGVRRSRSRLPIGINPWTTEPLVVASIDFVKRADVLPAATAAPWDVVVIDEAHGVAGISDRHDAAAAICRRAAYVLLLTATPHNGNDEAFASLLAIGSDPRTSGTLNDGLIVFRRSRLEAGRDAGRRVHTIPVHLSDAERAMHAALGALTTAIRRERSDLDRAVSLMLSLLHKRALSSAFALAVSARRRLSVLECRDPPIDEQLRLPFDLVGEIDEADMPPMWSEPALQDRRREQRLLRCLVDAAHRACECEAKFRRLHRLLGTIREPAIVFTEYRDTLLHLREAVAPHAPVIHGGLSRDQRRAALKTFHDAGVLLATDAAGEGLNLQHHCRVVINLELPWNPMRLEQRIGRVDRIGQPRRVHAFHLVAAGTSEPVLLGRLSERITRAHVRVGAPDPLRGRPPWTEDQSADLAVFGREPGHHTGEGSADAERVPLTRLADEAAIEHRRALSIRSVEAAARVCGDGITAAAGGPLVRWHRDGALRSRLADRAVAVFRTCITDHDGRTIACRLDSVLVGDVGSSDVALEKTLMDIASIVANLTDRRRWIDQSLAIHTQFARTRCGRARQLLQMTAAQDSLIQPGLFDRRAEQEHTARAAIQQELVSAARERLAAAEAAAETFVSDPVPLLVLAVRPVRRVS